MKKIILFSVIFIFTFTAIVFAFWGNKDDSTKLILLISEQNIAGPQMSWWASEVDLSKTENSIARVLIREGYEVIEPSKLQKVMELDKAFKRVKLSAKTAIKLGSLSKADYVVIGKAIASAGGKVPYSKNIVSCFANISAKLIRIKDSRVIAYLDGQASSAHLDKISGGSEALAKAANTLALDIISALEKEKGGQE